MGGGVAEKVGRMDRVGDGGNVGVVGEGRWRGVGDVWMCVMGDGVKGRVLGGNVEIVMGGLGGRGSGRSEGLEGDMGKGVRRWDM